MCESQSRVLVQLFRLGGAWKRLGRNPKTSLIRIRIGFIAASRFSHTRNFLCILVHNIKHS